MIDMHTVSLWVLDIDLGPLENVDWMLDVSLHVEFNMYVWIKVKFKLGVYDNAV